MDDVEMCTGGYCENHEVQIVGSWNNRPSPNIKSGTSSTNIYTLFFTAFDCFCLPSEGVYDLMLDSNVVRIIFRGIFTLTCTVDRCLRAICRTK